MATINFEPVEYEKLSKPKKLALFLIIIGPDSAAQIINDFDETEVENLCREIASIEIMDEEMRSLITDEFASVIGDSYSSILGGVSYAQKALGIAKGDYKASNMIGRIGPVESASEIIEEISDMEPRQIFNLMRNEQSQAIAFLLSHLSSVKAADVISMLNSEQREEVIERIGSMDTTSQDVMGKVINALKEHISVDEQASQQRSGGVRVVADVVNSLDKDMGKAILMAVEENNPALGAAIRKKMFSFDDLSKISIPDMQRVAREVEMQDLVLAMKSANAALQDTIYKSVSKRAAETLKDEIDLLGAVRLKDVEAAQDRIIHVVRKLEEEGEITLDQDGEDRVID